MGIIYTLFLKLAVLEGRRHVINHLKPRERERERERSEG
jgi:hypothetical protein